MCTIAQAGSGLATAPDRHITDMYITIMMMRVQDKQINHFPFNPRWRCPYQAITRLQASSGRVGQRLRLNCLYSKHRGHRGPEARGMTPGQRWTPAKAHRAPPSPRATRAQWHDSGPRLSRGPERRPAPAPATISPEILVPWFNQITEKH